GDVTLNGNSFISSNLGTVADLTSNEAIYNFNANVNVTADTPAVDQITVTDKAEGTLKLGSANVTGTSTYAQWEIGKTKQVQYLNGGTGNTLTITPEGTTTATTEGYLYTFSQGHETPGDTSTAALVGTMDIRKDNGYTLAQIVQDYEDTTKTPVFYAGNVNAYSLLEDYNKDDDLGEMQHNNPERTTPRELTIYGNEHKFAGNGHTGITVTNVGDILNLKDISEISGWNEYAVNNEAGEVNLSGNTTLASVLTGHGSYSSTGTITVADASNLAMKELENSGTVNLEGGILGARITGGAININGNVTASPNKLRGDENKVETGKTLTLTSGSLNYAIGGEGKVTATEDLMVFAEIEPDLTIEKTVGQFVIAKSTKPEMAGKAGAVTGKLTVAADNPNTLLVNGGELSGGVVVEENSTFSNVIADAPITVGGDKFELNGNITSTLENSGTFQNGGLISGGVTNKAGATFINNCDMTAAGYGNYAGMITGAVKNEGSFTTNAAAVTGGIENNANLTLTGSSAALGSEITGSGTTVIDGDITSEKKITNAVTVNSGKSLTIGASNLNGETTNNGTVNLTGGTLAKAITGDGMVTLKDTETAADVTVNSLKLAGAVTVKGVTLTADNNTAAADGAEITGTGADNTAINSGSLAGEGSASFKDITVNVEKNLDIAGSLSAANAAVNVKDAAVITKDAILDGVKFNSANTTINGGLTMANSSKITGDVTVKGNMTFKGSGTNEIKGTAKPYGYVDFWLDGYNDKDAIVRSTGTFDLSNTKTSAADGAPYGIRLFQDTDPHRLPEREQYIALIEGGVTGYKGSHNKYLPDEMFALRKDMVLTGYKYGVYEENGTLYTAYMDLMTLQRGKSLAEGRMAATAALNEAADLVSGNVMRTLGATENEWQSFAAVGGSHGHYDTGSYIDTNGTNVAAGLAKKLSKNTTIGIFAEGGYSHYNSHNDVEGFGAVTAKGDVNYFGGGLLLKTETDIRGGNSFYGEASVRAGHQSQDYDSETILPGTSVRYDADSRYIAAHAGIGYKHKLKSGSTIDSYVKYLYSHQGGVDLTLEATGENVNYEPIESRRVRAGFRYTKEAGKNLKAFGGLAYEYEFSSEAASSTEGLAIAAPNMKGGSGVAELGMSYKKNGSPWEIDFSVNGAAGRRESIGVSLSAWYEFDRASKKQKIKEQPLPNTTLDAAPKTEIPAADIEQYKTPVTIDTTEEQEKPANTSETAKNVKKITTERQPVKTEVKQEANKQAKSAVQIGASPDKGACEGLAAKARKAGFDAKVTTVQKGNATIYRVRVFSDNLMSQPLLKQVKAKGFDGFVAKD
ncbi:MAG: SPOR domain-containing protein, partial [Synergistaceae bacterium]|nr:SPOR domain-containing protein [Candidatus Equadaptatus faecalis]